MIRKLWRSLGSGEPTLDDLRRESLALTVWTVPLWLVMHLPMSSAVPPLALQPLWEGLHWAVAWLLVPLCVLATTACGAYAIGDRGMREALPYAGLILLAAIMLRDVLGWVT